MIAYRAAEWDTPWWARPNRAPGRYNTAGSEPTQYLTEHPLTVFAECLRAMGPMPADELSSIRWRCWAIDIEVEPFAEVTFENAGSYGLTAEDLVDDDWSACQQLADRSRGVGLAGLIVPSAALAGTRNLVVFGPRLRSPYLQAPVDPTIDVPTAHSAEDTSPPAELLPLVRWTGTPHAGLTAWQAGTPMSFIDPTPPSP